MAITTFNGLLSRWASGYNWQENFVSLIPANTTAAPMGGSQQTCQGGSSGCLNVMTVPTLETGVTAYIATQIGLLSTVGNGSHNLVCKRVNLGSLNISGASGTFTDGNAMPSVTECGVSRTVASAVIGEVTTVLNATPGTFTITYVDQDGNTAETTAAHTPANSAAVGSAAHILLNSPDWGVQDITAAARSGGTTPTGVIKFWGIIPLGVITTNTGGAYQYQDLVTTSPCLYQLGAGDDIGIFTMGGNASNNSRALQGYVKFIGASA